MDEADLAQESIDFHTSLAVRRVVGAVGAKDFSPLQAQAGIDCGLEIPEARRIAAPGCTRCVRCQAAAEGDDA